MAIVQLNGVTLAFGAQVVLEDVSLQIQEGERIGLVGVNGSGKTTLLRIAAGTLPPDSGGVGIRRRLRIGFLEQEPTLPDDANVHDAALAAFSDLLAMERRMREIEHEIAEADETGRAALLKRLGALQQRFEHEGGYEREHRTAAVLTGLGFRQGEFTKPVSVLSGGERSRLALARLLLREADLLLLDEPTNHLDLDGIEWLEELLGKGGARAVLLVSHDRTFLDRTVTKILHLEHCRLKAYPGNYSQYAVLKARARVEHQRRHDRQQAFIAKEEAFIRRYHAGQRHREARGRKKRLDRVARVERPATQKDISLRFEQERASGEVCVRFNEAGKRFGGQVLFEGVGFEIYRGEKVGIIGPNGSGKTTLLRMLLGDAAPDEGRVERGHHVTFGYLPQEVGATASARTVLDEVWERDRRLNEVDVRRVLGRFLLSGDDAVNKRLCDLSGGERTRVALAGLIVERPNVLVLDEPTNHLDIASREALDGALKAYAGTVVVVSHDRYFLNRVVEKLIAIEAGQARTIHGGYEAYDRERAAAAVQRETAPEATTARTRVPGQPKKARPRISKNRLAQLEKEIGALEKEKDALAAALASPALYADAHKARETPRRYQDVCARLEGLYHEWMGQEPPDNA